MRVQSARDGVCLSLKWGCSSVVEHLPFKQGVEGSIPSTLIFLPACQLAVQGRFN